MLHELRLLGIALQFLTRVPLPRSLGFEPGWLAASARHFPLVGLGVGAAGAAVLWAAAALWPLPVAVGLSMAATVWLTGGFHEDGLADTLDALGGSVSRERALQIMKDSRIGSYGALALVLVLGLEAAALLGLAQHGLAMAALPALLLAHAVSRSVSVVLMRVLPYAGDVEAAKAKPLAAPVSRAVVAVAIGWSMVLALVLATRVEPRAIAASLAGATIAGVLCARWFHRRLGGFTGDTLGAAQQLSELAALLGWLAAA